jgi:hypothetical protein
MEYDGAYDDQDNDYRNMHTLFTSDTEFYKQELKEVVISIAPMFYRPGARRLTAARH